MTVLGERIRVYLDTRRLSAREFSLAAELNPDEVARILENPRRIPRLETLRKLNGCDETGTQWAEGCTLYASKTGTPVVTLIHPGAHNFPPEAPALFVKFFKEHARN